jgi:ATP-dependent DNA ligase
LPAPSQTSILPSPASKPPTGLGWIHEIKHDGFRIIARKDRARVRLYSRPGNDLTDRFPLIVEALARLRSRSCIIDGEAGCCDEDGMPSFDSIRYRRHGIVSKRKDSIYRSGRSPDWLKMKNPGASGGAAGDRGGLGENAAYPPV